MSPPTLIATTRSKSIAGALELDDEEGTELLLGVGGATELLAIELLLGVGATELTEDIATAELLVGISVPAQPPKLVAASKPKAKRLQGKERIS